MTLEWKHMKDAPRTGEKHVLLFTTDHGIVEAYYSPGSWDNNHEGLDYYGPVWVCGDGAYEIEVCEYPEEPGNNYPFHDGSAKAWAEIPNLPPDSLIKGADHGR